MSDIRVKMNNSRENVEFLHHKVFSNIKGDECVLVLAMGNARHYNELRKVYPNLKIYGIEHISLKPTLRYCMKDLNCNIVFYEDIISEKGQIECVERLKKVYKKNEKKDMTFDFVGANPPYGRKTENTHLKIMKCILKYCTGKLVFIMPSKPITHQVDKEWYDMLKNAVCYDIEVVNENVFVGTKMDRVAIYYCDKTKSPEEYCEKLDIDKSLYNSLDDEGRMFIDIMCKFKPLKIFIGWDRRRKDAYPNMIDMDKYYLNVSRANGSINAQWLSSTLNKYPVMTGAEEIEDLKNRTAVVNVIKCPNKLYGEKLKALMSEGKVLRYALWINQIDQNMCTKVFQYVPDIAYDKLIGSTPKALDKSLLLTCGCSEDKADKILNYLDTFDFEKSRNDMVRNFILK
jgi:hypothetical protein